MNESSRFGTRCIHAGQSPDPTTGAIMTPVYMTSTFVQRSPGVFKDGYDYARSKNPTRTALESNLAALEGGKHGMAFSSGLAAMDCVLHQLRAGDHVVLSDDVYGGTFRQLDKIFRHHAIDVTRVDMTNLGAVREAMRPSTRLVWLETPSNPMLKVIDIAGVRAVVDEHGPRAGKAPGVRDAGLGPLGTPIEKPFQVTLPVPIIVVNIPNGLAVSLSPQIVQLQLTGQAARLANLDPAKLQGIVNAQGRSAGTGTFEPSFNLPSGITIVGTPPRVTVTLRPSEQRTDTPTSAPEPATPAPSATAAPPEPPPAATPEAATSAPAPQ